DNAYQATIEHLGFSTPAALSPRIPVILVKEEDRYRKLASSARDDQDLKKAAAYPCFCTTDPKTFQHLGVVQWQDINDYSKILTMQAAAELALRQQSRGKKVPRWFLEGVACCEGRYSSDELARWSAFVLRNGDGLAKIDDHFFESYEVTNQNILQAG